jgi:DNA-3-methyladenine glycosylase
LMTRRRLRNGRRVEAADLCRGPGNLTQALGITLKQNRTDLSTGPLWIEDRGLAAVPVAWTPRVGIRVGVERPWRCSLAGHASVSGRK